VRLEETHDAYEALLHEAEARLERVYRSAMEGTDLDDDEAAAESGKGEGPAAAGPEGGAGDAAVQEEVVAVLKQAEEGKPVESVRLVDRQLRQLPEAFGRILGLRVLDVSRNQLEVTNWASSCMLRSIYYYLFRVPMSVPSVYEPCNAIFRVLVVDEHCYIPLFFYGLQMDEPDHVMADWVFFFFCITEE